MLDLQPRSSGDLDWVALRGNGREALTQKVGMWDACVTGKPSRVLRREPEMRQKQVKRPPCEQG